MVSGSQVPLQLGGSVSCRPECSCSLALPTLPGAHTERGSAGLVARWESVGTLIGGGSLPLGPGPSASQQALACSRLCSGAAPPRPAAASPLAPASWPIPCS